ncbi:hypothetical protein D3C87_2001750 [compost metagenome]
MQYGGIRAIFRQIVGGTVVKAHADGKDHVRVMHGFVGFVSPVHTEHADALTVRAGKRAQSHQGAGNR